MNAKAKSSKPGTSTSAPEVTNISPHGLWLFVDGSEHFLSFEEFPWFENATVGEIHAVTRPSKNRLRWASLDVDLALDSIKDPGGYPLVARDRPVSSRTSAATPTRKPATAKPRKPSRR
ncbi:MAG: DUF2442 domain-containing protein [Candidatus Eisenbacteria bacterium]